MNTWVLLHLFLLKLATLVVKVMKNREYWSERFVLLEKSQLNKGQNLNREIEKHYSQALRKVEDDISGWYSRFAVNNQISMVEAKALLTKRELKELQWSVEDYINFGQKNAVDPKWLKELENASARVHVSRLESVKLQIQQQMEVLHGGQLDSLDGLMRDIYSEGYYHTAYEIQKGFNIGWDLQKINTKQLDRIISKPWTVDGKTFSDRIWSNNDQLVSSVHNQLTQGILLGRSPKEAIASISDEFGVSRRKAGRLIMTESAFFASAAQQKAFSDLDVELYEIVATLDMNTSEICQELDGKVFDMKDYQVGVSAPPFHPWCRSVTAPYFEDDDDSMRAARGADGQTYYVDGKMKYADWKKSFVDGGSKVDLPKVVVPDSKDVIKKFGSMAEHSDHWFDLLTNDEKDVLQEYTSGNGMDILEYHRQLHYFEDLSSVPSEYIDELNEKTKLIDNAIEKYGGMDNDQTLFRGVGDSYWKETFGLDDEDFYEMETVKKKLIGKTVKDDAYVSMSFDIDEADYFSSSPMMRIEVPEGTKGAYLGKNSAIFDQDEFLLARGHKMEFTNITLDDKYGLIVDVKIIPMNVAEDIVEDVTEETIGIFKEAKNMFEAEEFARKFGISADYSKYKIEVANSVNKTLTEIESVFGEGSLKELKNIGTFPDGYSTKYAGAFVPSEGSLWLRNVGRKGSLEKLESVAKVQFEAGYWSTGDALHTIRHEIGHAIHNSISTPEKMKKINQLRKEVQDELMKLRRTGNRTAKYSDWLSDYGMSNAKEFVAESVAEYLTGNPRETAKKVISILTGR